MCWFVQPSMAELHSRWHIPEALAHLIERECYQKICGPSGVAPRTKQPLTLSSEMTAAHWVNFAKVYGKYLLTQCFSGISMVIIRDLLDIVRMCLSSRVEPDMIAHIKSKVEQFADCFDAYLPGTEKSIVLHLLLWHMPDTIAYWGPARGYWCFPFER